MSRSKASVPEAEQPAGLLGTEGDSAALPDTHDAVSVIQAGVLTTVS